MKLAMAIIGISSIHLLKSFIEAGQLGLPLCTPALQQAAALCAKVTATGVMWQTIIPVSYTHLDVYKRQARNTPNAR